MAAADVVNDQQFGINQIAAGRQSVRLAAQYLGAAREHRLAGNKTRATQSIAQAKVNRQTGRAMLRGSRLP